MDNLVLLCRHHHRLVHEGGYGVRMTGDSIPEFTDPTGQILTAAPQIPSRGNVIALRRQNGKAGLEITPETPVPLWEGEKLDSSMAIETLLWLESPQTARIDDA